MTQTVEQHAFQAEVQQLLDIVINSLYSNKDVFLRELISNASDALDKRRFAALTDDAIGADDLFIRIDRDPDKRTLSIVDNGIGMSREEVVTNLGTIAKSGTSEFLDAARDSSRVDLPELIGQFGVGFYASFMVADRVTVVTRRAGETEATRWESAGRGEFTLADAERDEPGTTVTLHLKSVDDENGIKDFTNEWVIREIVRHYSDFVAYPIRMEVEKRTPVEGKEGETRVERSVETLNSMKAIWTRPKDEVTDEEYQEFYRHITHDWHPPLTHLAVRMEGTLEARALLYVPSQAPPDLYHREMSYRGLQLYVRRVFIMDECRDLMPPHLRFVKGVVDAEDLSLNVSREMLQKDRQIAAIRRFLVKRIMDELARLKRTARDQYVTFWAEFGPVLKEGLLAWEEKHDALFDLLLTHSSAGNEPVSLEEYIDAMRPDQEYIYYLVAPTLAAARQSPQAEVYLDRGYQVLYFTDPVDEIWLAQAQAYKDKKWKSVGQGDVDLGAAGKDAAAAGKLDQQRQEQKGFLDALSARLSDHVKAITLTNRLTSSAACLVGDANELTPQMAEIMRRMGQDVPDVKRTLELNPDHPIVSKLRARFESEGDSEAFGLYAHLLYHQATLAEGGQPDDPAAVAKSIASLMERSL